jgi:hypothetical protein
MLAFSASFPRRRGSTSGPVVRSRQGDEPILTLNRTLAMLL